MCVFLSVRSKKVCPSFPYIILRGNTEKWMPTWMPTPRPGFDPLGKPKTRAFRARSMRVPCAFLARSSHFSAFRCFYIIAVNTRGTRSKRVNLPLL